MKKTQIIFATLFIAITCICLNTSTILAQISTKNNLNTASCTWQDAKGNSCEDKNCNNKCDKDETLLNNSTIVLPDINTGQLIGTLGGTDPCRVSICNGLPLNFFKQQSPTTQQSIIQQRESGIPLSKVVVNGQYPFATMVDTKPTISVKPNIKPASPK